MGTRVAMSHVSRAANVSLWGLSYTIYADMVPAPLLPATWAWGEALWAKGTPAG
jgi:hypothetical protein